MVKRRPHLKGWEHGIALDIQLSLFRWKGTEEQPALTAHERGALQAVMADGITTEHRRHEQGLAEDDACPMCGEKVAERQRHMYWECTWSQSIRDKYFTPSR